MFNRRQLFGTISGAVVVLGAKDAAAKPDYTCDYSHATCVERLMKARVDTGKPASYSDEEWAQQLAARAKGLHVVRFWHEGKQIAPAVEKKIDNEFCCCVVIDGRQFTFNGMVTASDNPGLHRCSIGIVFQFPNIDWPELHDSLALFAVCEDPGIEMFLWGNGSQRTARKVQHPMRPLGSF